MTQLTWYAHRIIVIIIMEGFYLNICIILIIDITTKTIMKYLIFPSCDSDGYIISKCPEQDLSSLWMSFLHCVFFFNPQGSFLAITL